MEEDILFHILQYLNVKEIKNLAQTNQTTNRLVNKICQSLHFWQTKLPIHLTLYKMRMPTSLLDYDKLIYTQCQESAIRRANYNTTLIQFQQQTLSDFLSVMLDPESNTHYIKNVYLVRYKDYYVLSLNHPPYSRRLCTSEEVIKLFTSLYYHIDNLDIASF